MSRRKKRCEVRQRVDERYLDAPPWILPLIDEPDDDPSSAMKDYAAFWREWEAETQRIVALSRVAAPGVAADLVESVRSQWVSAHQALEERFGLDLSPDEPGFQDVRLPKSQVEYLEFNGLLRQYESWDLQLALLERVLPAYPSEEAGRVAILLLAVSRQSLAPAFFHETMADGFPAERAGALYALSGHARTHIRREWLVRALMPEAGYATASELERALLSLLPGATMRALGDRPAAPWTEALRREYRNAIAKDIQGEALEQGKCTTKTTVVGDFDLVAGDHLSPSPEEAFLAMETVREEQCRREQAEESLHEVWRSAGLTDLEMQIMAYDQRRYKTGQIASALGTSSNSVSVLKNKARRKLARYERDHTRATA